MTKEEIIATAIREWFTDLRAGLQANNEAYTMLCKENKKMLAHIKKQQTTNKKLSALKYKQESVIDKLKAELLACKEENKKLKRLINGSDYKKQTDCSIEEQQAPSEV